ncbi:hypothetical protein CDL15_Pgr025090 [Punica granatum]|uniref:GATA-type domain-containing protein n=1 Tax=Punica granatum TaxID=22663 RepID=A0A218W8M5_PUNGR|nr:hypothetical protein CDL15_Pgr025090 [Punica granatum]
MVGPLLLDDFNGNPDEFYDNVIKHIDFPLEDVVGNVLDDDWDERFQLLELPSSDILAGLPSGLGGKLCDDDSGPLSTTPEGKPKLKDSSQVNGEATSDRHILFGGIKDSSLFQTTSGSVSVLESGSSWSGYNSVHFGVRFFIPVKRARSKRLRPPTLNPRLTSIPFISFSEKRKGKKKNLSVLSGGNNNNEPTLLSNGTRKCSHCEVTKTPQWREGPMGPKTLCNACGVRYRSGRLFPEYRPAASPTFIASLHSNSHKKVVEMRKKVSREGAVSNDSMRPSSRQLENSDGCLSV